ncbi:tyrosine-type recombinase/integrase [Azospirillum sp. B510]|uniref:tyrosine-type recombinase/integrase n=1 Tax=Azospirillum sp. (strain B510) TaxID=137722 RepID=UPI0005A9B31B|nr:tyrosine-type recombinase/integrase [Azospirillum sp. B510]
MARTTTLITPQILRDALALAARGDADEEIGDTVVRGLCLRLRRASAVWAVRGRIGGKGNPQPFRLCDARPDGGGAKALERELEKARALATEAKKRLAAGEDPRDWLREQDLGRPMVVQTPAVDLGPTYREALDAWVDHLLSIGRRVDTVKSYRSCLISPAAMDAFGGKHVRELTPADVKTARDRLIKEGKLRQSDAVVQAVGALVKWATEDKETPVGNVERLGNSGASSSDDDGEGTYTPLPKELANLFVKLGAPGVNPVGRLACVLLLCTAQRRLTVASARPRDFEEWDLVPGWGLWRIPKGLMKGKKAHVIPLPPRAWKAVQTAVELAGPDAAWVFPQTRKRRATDEGNGHIAPKLINDCFRAAKIGWAPHDTRRALGALADRRGVPLAKIATILAHRAVDVPQVTAEHYGRELEYRNDKHYVLSEWMSYLEECDKRYGSKAQHATISAA